MLKNIIKILILTTFVASISQASEVSAFVVVSPVGDFTAEFKDVKMKVVKAGDTYKTESPIVIPWKTVDTGMAMRNTHTLKYFNADKYPNIEILSSLGKAGQGAAKVKMNGVEKIVKGTYKIKDNKMLSEMKIKLSEFNVKNINFKGAGVDDEVVIKVSTDL